MVSPFVWALASLFSGIFARVFRGGYSVVAPVSHSAMAGVSAIDGSRFPVPL